MAITTARQRQDRENKMTSAANKSFCNATEESVQIQEGNNRTANGTSSKPTVSAASKIPPTYLAQVLRPGLQAHTLPPCRWHECASKSKCHRRRAPRSLPLPKTSNLKCEKSSDSHSRRMRPYQRVPSASVRKRSNFVRPRRAQSSSHPNFSALAVPEQMPRSNFQNIQAPCAEIRAVVHGPDLGTSQIHIFGRVRRATN